jgi:ribosome-binding protein aMBF1 (putative translation factor)
MDHQDWKVKVLNPTKVQKAKKEPKMKTSPELKAIEESESGIDYVPKEISIEMQKVRCEKKLKQEDLAKKCNLPTSIIKNYENGKAVMIFSELRKINKILGTNFKITKKVEKE